MSEGLLWGHEYRQREKHHIRVYLNEVGHRLVRFVGDDGRNYSWRTKQFAKHYEHDIERCLACQEKDQ
jgi:hypothetical protein